MYVAELLESNDIAERAKALFGITHNPREAGYILPDGTMLDLSGRHKVGDYIRHPSGTNVLKNPGSKASNLANMQTGTNPGQDWLQDRRDIDHREVNNLYHVNDGTVAMHRFMHDASAIRFLARIGIDVVTVPTPKQLAKALAAHFTITSDSFMVEISDPNSPGNLAHRSFKRTDIAKVLPFIQKYLA